MARVKGAASRGGQDGNGRDKSKKRAKPSTKAKKSKKSKEQDDTEEIIAPNSDSETEGIFYTYVHLHVR
jgi:hypothetical protein